MLLILTACTGGKSVLEPDPFEPIGSGDTNEPSPDVPGTGSPPDTGDLPALIQVQSPSLDDGFGSALAIDGDVIWVSAPHGQEGHVYRIEGLALERVITGSGRLGSALAVGPDGVLIGAPLSGSAGGQVVDASGTVIMSGMGGTGLALLGGSRPVAAHGSGWTRLDGTGETTTHRPSSLAMREDQVGVGMARGEDCLQVGDQTLSRPNPADFAGLSLITADLDGDGSGEWILGAPGSGSAYILDGETLEVRREISEASLGFGTALAACRIDGDEQIDLVVGAPGGEETRGEVWIYTDPLSGGGEPRWAGESLGQFLGSAVTCTDGLLVMGAPGGGAQAGQTWVVR